MSHDLETRDGKVTFALRGAPAWHGLAQHIFGDDEHVTTAEMLDAALLSNWNVRLEQWETPDGYTADRNFFRVIRDNPFNPEEKNILGSVGERYRTYQNEDLFTFGDSILDGGALWESAGSIKNGRVVFGSLRLPKEIILDPNGRADRIDTYLLVTTSHDGSASIKACTTPVRVVCQNTLNLAMGQVKVSYNIRHSASAKDRSAEARRALGLSFAYLDKFNAEVEALIQQDITDKQWDEIVTTLFPVIEDAGRAKTMRDNAVDTVRALYANSPTMDNIRGTAWGAVNALTERLDYFRTGRGDNKSENMAAAASGFDAATAAERQRIYDVVKTLTLV